MFLICFYDNHLHLSEDRIKYDIDKQAIFIDDSIYYVGTYLFIIYVYITLYVYLTIFFVKCIKIINTFIIILIL